MKQTIELNGKLTLAEDSYEYLITDGEIETNLSDILSDYYMVKNPVVYIAIEMNGRTALCEEGYLYYTPDGDNVWSYFLEGENIDRFLFNHTGEYMNIVMRMIDSGAKK